MNWPAIVEYLQTCPPAKTREQLLHFAMGKCKVKRVRPKIRLPRGVKRETLPQLKKELDRVFSIFIRRRDASGDYGVCRTCKIVRPWREMDCGHYRPRQDLSTRWDERNCHLQCKSCNGFRGGEAEKMARYIDDKYGEPVAELLQSIPSHFPLKRDWLERKIREYKKLIGETNGATRTGEARNQEGK